MASKLIRFTSHEAENQLELSLRQAFNILEPNLRPPFPLTIPTSQEYLNLNQAILYGVLTEPHYARVHMKHLHGIVTDGYAFFVSLNVQVVNELFEKLVDSSRNQVMWVARELVDVSAEGFNALLVSLLRQIVGGEFSSGNLWLCVEAVSLFLDKWSSLLEEEPMVLNSGLYTFLRLLADHCRFSGDAKLEELVSLEIRFCTRMLTEQFQLCLKIGRDLIRLLQDLVHVPEFRALWKDFILNPSKFGTPGFSDISQLYGTRTSSHYFLLRVSPEMEAHLRFLLTHVKFGSQKRHQVWFFSKYLCTPERESVICDIVRFICCGHHPHKEVTRSDIIPRWAVIGWLLKSCRKNYVGANVKLALFYDWLFFDERIDKLMNIEPAMILMESSITRYIEITNSLLEFLFLLVDNYDVERKEITARGVSSSFSILRSKGVIQNPDILTSSEGISLPLRERLGSFLLGTEIGISKELPKLTFLGTPTPSPQRLTDVHKTESGSVFVDPPVNSCTPAAVASSNQHDMLQCLVQNLGDSIKKSNLAGLSALQEILDLYVSADELPVSGLSLQRLCLKISEEFERDGHRLFKPHEGCNLDKSCLDYKVDSFMHIIIRKYVLSRSERILEMLLFWSNDLFPVTACLLLYASRLASEANMHDSLDKLTETLTPLLWFHINGYLSLSKSQSGNSPEVADCATNIDRELFAKLLDDAFMAYRDFLVRSSRLLHREADSTLTKHLFTDLKTCLKWMGKRVKFLFHSIFCNLPDLSVGKADIVRLLMGSLEDIDFVSIQFEIGLKRLSVFGENAEAILSIIKSSLNWEHLQQHKFWSLLKLELSVSRVPLEKLMFNFFSSELNPSSCGIAVGGLLTLCSSYTPTPELVGAVMFLPNNNMFEDFSAAVLGLWSVSKAEVLFHSLAEFAGKFETQNGDSIFSASGNFTINRSAILWLLSHFSKKGMSLSSILSIVPSNIMDENEA